MHLVIAYSKIKKRNLVLINNDTHQRETLSERPIRLPLKHSTLNVWGGTAPPTKKKFPFLFFVLYLKIINNFWKIGYASYKKVFKELENGIEILVGQAVFKLYVKTIKMLVLDR